MTSLLRFLSLSQSHIPHSVYHFAVEDFAVEFRRQACIERLKFFVLLDRRAFPLQSEVDFPQQVMRLGQIRVQANGFPDHPFSLIELLSPEIFRAEIPKSQNKTGIEFERGLESLDGFFVPAQIGID